MTPPFDFIILGSGTTAFAGALKAVELGARVLMVEQSQLGGTCVNWGCIPSKTLIDKAESYFHARRGNSFGLRLSTAPADCERLMRIKQETVDLLRQKNYQKILDAHPGIQVRRGHGRFLSPRELRVGEEILVSDRFLIACGGNPRVLPIPGLHDAGFLTSYSALHLPCFPKSMIIMGGGVIALEMGQMFRRFGTEVTIIERGERILKDFDPRLTVIFEQLAAEEGISFHFGVDTRRVQREGEEICVEASVNGNQRSFRAGTLMLAVGTAPATSGIGLEAAGVAVNEAGFIRTTEKMQTTAEGIWAAGDCTGPPLIAPAGVWEAEVAVENLLVPGRHRRIDHRHTPLGVFTDPEFASVGLSLTRARAEGHEVVETFLPLEQVAKSHVIGRPQGGIVLTAEKRSGRILGVEILAPRAADVIHEAVLAVRFGLTVHDLTTTVHVYPTISDGLRLAALANIYQRKAEPGDITPWHPGE